MQRKKYSNEKILKPCKDQRNVSEHTVSGQSPLGINGGRESRVCWVSGTTAICYHGNKGLSSDIASRYSDFLGLK